MKTITENDVLCSSKECDKKFECARHISNYDYKEELEDSYKCRWINPKECLESKLQFPYAFFEKCKR